MTFRRALLLGAALGLLGAAAIVGWLYTGLYVDRIADPDDTVHVVVPEGAHLGDVARVLVDAELLDAPWKLRLVARFEGGARRLRAGEFDLPRGASPDRLLRALVEGRMRTRAVTLPEGWSAERTVAVLADSLSVDRAALDSLVASPPEEWAARLDLPEGASLEGYLFPETYRFTRGVKPRTVIRTLLDAHEAVFVDSVRVRLEESGFTRHEWVTLASIVEAEAQVEDEFTRVAAVYRNRLEKGWRLEADPTVAFALGKPGDELTYRDLETESAYNTYRVRGLPPGPINNPGRRALIAALWPEPDFDAMYFVADGEGGHRFSRTWEEHRRAVQLYRQWQREQRRRGSG